MARSAASRLIVIAPLTAALLASCSSVVETASNAGSTTSGSGGASSTAASATAGTGSAGGGGGQGGSGGGSCGGRRELFEQTCKAGLLAECGSCHGLSGLSDIPFLAGSDVYATITAWPGVIGLSPTLGILFNLPVDGQHPALSSDLHDKLVPWVKAEAAALPPPDMPYHVRMKPILGGLNEISLHPFIGSSISFVAEQSAGPQSPLLLTHLEVHASSGISLHVKHPLFTLYPDCGGSFPDPADSLASVDQVYQIDADPKLGTGSVVLDGWKDGTRLDLSFEVLTPSQGPQQPNGCKALGKFSADIEPALAPCVAACHWGGDAGALAQMNLSKLGDIPPSAACAEVRMWIEPGNPDGSALLMATDPGRLIAHDFKFEGNKGDYQSFKAALSPWILAEQ